MKRKDYLEIILFVVLSLNVVLQSLASYTYIIKVDNIPQPVAFKPHSVQVQSEYFCSSGIIMVWKDNDDFRCVSFSVGESEILVKATKDMPHNEFERTIKRAKFMKREDFIALLEKKSEEITIAKVR